jgi:glucose-6-phosphate dehydrogenase assembly protein OpcA
MEKDLTAPIIATDFDSLRLELGRTSLSATTMNFIVWIDDVTFRDWVLERTAKILEKHPARAILLDACADARPGARLVRSEADGADLAHITVRGERVEIGVLGMPASDISELTASLTMNGLPTLLWWTGEGITGQPTFNALVDLADSLVVDSSGTRNDSTTVVELVRFLSSRPTVKIRDLAWMRLRPWQDMIARFFDDPTLMEELYSVRSLQIVSGSDAEALYLSGWLASRLGWTASGRDEFSDQSGAHIPFSSERAGRIRRVRSVELTTTTSTYNATVSDDDPAVVVVKASGKNALPGRFVPLGAVDSPSLLERAILEPASDEVFETALRMVGTIAG